MIEIIKKLNECEEIRACILVVKFNAKIDAQYKATMEYYSRLLPGLFEKNVIIVMTEFKTDDYSETLRKRQRINVEQVKRNTIVALQQCSNNQITYSPQLFTIDCLVVTPPQNQYDLDFKIDAHPSLTTRTAILDYIFHLKPIKVKDQMVAKTEYIKQKDAQEYEKLQGEINGYNLRLQEVHTNSKKVLNDTRQKKMEIKKTESEINYLKKKLQDKDKTDDVEAVNWSINEEGRVLRWFTREFDINSPYEISNYTTWTNGKSEFKEITQTSHAVSGRVQGSFMRGIYASVTAYTQKRMKYAEEITELNRRIAREKTNLTRCKAAWEDFRMLHKEKLEEINLLEKYIDEKNTAVKKCQSDLMTLDEAKTRLDEMQKMFDSIKHLT